MSSTSTRDSMFDLDLSFLDHSALGAYDMNHDEQHQHQQHLVMPQQPLHHHHHHHQQQQQQQQQHVPQPHHLHHLHQHHHHQQQQQQSNIEMFNSQFLSLELGDHDTSFDFFQRNGGLENISFDTTHPVFEEESKEDDFTAPMSKTTKAKTTTTKKSTTKNKPTRQYKKRKSENTDAGVPQSPKKNKTIKNAPPAVNVTAPPATTAATTTTPMATTPTTKSRQTSSFRGVSCCGKDRKFQARIREANRVRYLGRFATEVEAALVYDQCARAIKGPECPTNFVQLSAQQQEELKRAYVENGFKVPQSMSQWVRGKVKAKKSPKRAGSSKKANFPDSPVAKVRATAQAPVISPKSTSKLATSNTYVLNPDQKLSAPPPPATNGTALVF